MPDNKAKSSSETITIISKDDVTNGYSHQSGTWNYEASEVSDFSFCLSDHFVWDAANLKVEDRDVLINSFYNITMADKAAELTSIQQKVMKHFSENMPGIPYPYPEFTTCVMGVRGGGMETPMMANNGGPGRGVTIHEMFHTYFPMYVRTNERRWAWMDEGWATYNTAIVENRFFEDDYEIANVFSSVNPEYSGTMGTIADLPLITSSQFLTDPNYGYASYPLPAMIYAIIHQHLGEETFLKCYQEYIKRWAKKSPTPYDFFYTFENVSCQDLSWLWIPWFFEFGVSDVAIKSFEENKLIVINQGNKPVPIFVKITYKKGEPKLISQSANIWANGKNETQVTIPNYKRYGQDECRCA